MTSPCLSPQETAHSTPIPGLQSPQFCSPSRKEERHCEMELKKTNPKPSLISASPSNFPRIRSCCGGEQAGRADCVFSSIGSLPPVQVLMLTDRQLCVRNYGHMISYNCHKTVKLACYTYFMGKGI